MLGIIRPLKKKTAKIKNPEQLKLVDIPFVSTSYYLAQRHVVLVVLELQPFLVQLLIGSHLP
jgi:hypothetical protein